MSKSTGFEHGKVISEAVSSIGDYFTGFYNALTESDAPKAQPKATKRVAKKAKR